MFTGWREHKATYRGLHAGEDMWRVPPNFIFYKIVQRRNFDSSQCHTSAIHPTPLNSTTHKLNSK
jgi:hypothetical protein